MRRDTRAIFPATSSFLSCPKDTETILRKLFVESAPYSDYLKKLLVVNTKDCLDNLESQIIKDAVAAANLKTLIDNQYIKLNPKIRLPEHEEVKSYIILSMDNFTQNDTNEFYRDYIITFDIICHLDYWDIGDYRLRPLMIAGYIDNILNNSKLSGIGITQFISCNELILDENLAGYTLTYRTVHGYDDKIPPKDAE